MWWWWIGIFVGSLLLWAWTSARRPRWAPPGPRLVPWLGNMLDMDLENPCSSYIRWAQKYGRIFYVQLGSQRQVVLNDADLIRETFSKSELASRPDSQLLQFQINGNGLALSIGEKWYVSRRFTLHHLRNFGMGKSRLEATMVDQIEGFMKTILEPSVRQPVEFDTTTLNAALVNIIWNMVTSEQLDISDTWVLKKIQELTEVTTTDVEPLQYVDCFPILKHLMPRRMFDEAKLTKKYQTFLREFLLPTIEDHRKSFNAEAEPRDYIDALLQEQVRRPDIYKEQHIYWCIIDIFFASNETTATTLRWAFCFACNHPETQRKVQDEIDQVTGGAGGRKVSLSDRVHMPYTEAFILETQRRGDIVPLGLPHSPFIDTQIAGYVIPAGVSVIANLRAVHLSPEHFPQPLQFRPDRFINAEGRFTADKHVMPFSTGKRQCLGEAMARAEVFLFLTQILQRYTLRWPEGFRHKLGETSKLGLFMSPEPYQAIPEPR